MYVVASCTCLPTHVMCLHFTCRPLPHIRSHHGVLMAAIRGNLGVSEKAAEMWKRLPPEAGFREVAGWLASGTHPRMGMGSPLRVLAELPEIVHSIMLALVSAPLVVPDDYGTLQEACNRAVEMQTIVLRPGEHSLTIGRLQPTKVEKELHILGQPGAVLVGGLHLGIGSCGSLRKLTIHGHLWVYGCPPPPAMSLEIACKSTGRAAARRKLQRAQELIGPSAAMRLSVNFATIQNLRCSGFFVDSEKSSVQGQWSASCARPSKIIMVV